MLLKDADRRRAPRKGWIHASMVPLLSVKPVSGTELAPSALPPCHCYLGRLSREGARIGLPETHRLGAPESGPLQAGCVHFLSSLSQITNLVTLLFIVVKNTYPKMYHLNHF